MIDVTLSWPEVLIAAQVGAMRRVAAHKKALKGKHGAPDECEKAWGIDVYGSAAEQAVAKHCNLYWNGTVGETDRRDVGDLIDVRSSSYKKPHLILHKIDPDEVPFVLVRAKLPRCCLLGWILARDGKYSDGVEDDPFNTGRPAFWVPSDKLQPMETLAVWLRDKRS